MPSPVQTLHPLSHQQIEAGLNLVDAFTCTQDGRHLSRWNILHAQMQSGKTGTYLFVAAEMLRQNNVDSVVIISGNTELALRKQIIASIAAFRRQYHQYMASAHPGVDDFDIIELFTAETSVVWGSNLTSDDSIYKPDRRILYILEESHVAQNKTMRPNKFLERIGISPNGDVSAMESANAYLLSVSATAFSEMCNVHHCGQSKQIVKLSPGIGYMSVETMFANNMIRTFQHKTWMNYLWSQLIDPEFQYGTPQYAIVRVNTVVAAQQIIKLMKGDAAFHHFEFCLYNSDMSLPDNIKSLDLLNVQPTTPTVIFIQGRCRMGQVLAKDYIGFCMETSSNSATDVVLQGLLGRMCGYHAHTHIRIHLSDTIVDSGELLRYIRFTQGEAILPRNATNLCLYRTPGERIWRHKYHPIIPIKIQLPIADRALDVDNMHIAETIRAEFIKEVGVVNYNGVDSDQTREIIDLVQHTPIVIKTLGGSEVDPTNVGLTVALNIHTSIKYKRPMPLRGVKSPMPCRIYAWHFTKPVPQYDICAGDIYIDARTSSESIFAQSLPDIAYTSGKEMFYGNPPTLPEPGLVNDKQCDKQCDTKDCIALMMG